jgi:hypothetical protein
LQTPTTLIISSGVIAPGLSITGTSSTTFTTVDSNPIWVSPPSTIADTLFSSSCLISSIVVPDGFPDTFALGAAIGTPLYCIIAFAIMIYAVDILAKTVKFNHIVIFIFYILWYNMLEVGCNCA